MRIDVRSVMVEAEAVVRSRYSGMDPTAAWDCAWARC